MLWRDRLCSYFCGDQPAVQMSILPKQNMERLAVGQLAVGQLAAGQLAAAG